MGGLKDMRPSSIAGAVWRCGKPNCHCARAEDPGHGPHLRLTYKSGGKTVTEALPTPAAVRKAEQEIAEFRSYQKLGHELVEVSEQICRLLQVVLAGNRKTGQVDLEAIEMLVRDSMHRAGAAALERFAFHAGAALLCLPALPSRADPARRGIRCGRHGELARSAADDGSSR